MNLSGPTWYSNEWVFVDLMKSTGEWVSRTYPELHEENRYTFNDGRTVQLRAEDGYPASLGPNQIAHLLFARDVFGEIPSGVYTCLFDGDGVVDAAMDARVISRSLCPQEAANE